MRRGPALDNPITCRHLEIQAQALTAFSPDSVESIKLFLTLHEAALLAPGDLPYVSCTLSVMNHATRCEDVLSGAAGKNRESACAAPRCRQHGNSSRKCIRS